jgi:hypothetical protein
MSSLSTIPYAEAPSGLPDDDGEEPPLGVDDPDPEGDETGPEAMPGIPTEGEPPSSG